MDYSITFARHFSRLIWLLLNDTNAVDEQKSALRALVHVIRDGPVTITAADWKIRVNGSEMPDALTGVQDLSAQMIGHSVLELALDQGAIPADILGVARILAAEPIPGGGGKVVQDRLAALGARTVRVTVKPPEMIPRGLTPTGVPVIGPGSVSAPAPAASDAARSSGSIRSHAPTPQDIAAVSSPAPLDVAGELLAFAARQQPSGGIEQLLGKLKETRSVSQTTRLLDELVILAENANREGRPDLVSRAFDAIARGESDATDADLKRAYTMAVRRMAKPTLLRAVAAMLPRAKDTGMDLLAVLARTGEDGADALIEQLSTAQNASDRRTYFDALLKVSAGVQTLVHHLGDARWYVARNAADLLGEMAAPEAEAPLGECLKHDDDRVRRAAANALAKLGTPNAMKSLHEAMKDTSPQVRLQAAAGLASRKGLRTSGTLIKALDEEEDPEVQYAILGALGKVATADAVQALIRAAEPAGGFFRKKPAAFRVAAVQALGEARTAASLAALRELANDKEQEVKDAVFRVMVQVQAAG